MDTLPSFSFEAFPSFSNLNDAFSDQQMNALMDPYIEDVLDNKAREVSINFSSQKQVSLPGPNSLPRVSKRQTQELKPHPFFYYEDFSKEEDPDPMTSLTYPGRAPNFPAKMHAILNRDDFCDVISWLPHGRAWRVLKPKQFEQQVIPMFFEHTKFSSFVRQANGWGFRRITQGRDRNSYYHPLFLRGLPHLAKRMKRPGVAEKTAADPDHEPDLQKISEMFPLPQKADPQAIKLHCTILTPEEQRSRRNSAQKATEPSKTDEKQERSDGQSDVPTNSNASVVSATGSTGSLPRKASPDPSPASTFTLHSISHSYPPAVGQYPPPYGHTAPSRVVTAPAPPAHPSLNMSLLPPEARNVLENRDGGHSSQYLAGYAAAMAMSQQQMQTMMQSLGSGMSMMHGHGHQQPNQRQPQQKSSQATQV